MIKIRREYATHQARRLCRLGGIEEESLIEEIPSGGKYEAAMDPSPARGVRELSYRSTQGGHAGPGLTGLTGSRARTRTEHLAERGLEHVGDASERAQSIILLIGQARRLMQAETASS
ncbi:hypothetical protein PG994_005532 [Apiospora phragmitis]|uniref:Uncharacterized protein n=1 Tax=Apiospora phragmitis TaxID=2905665 RepID=A0ABR1VF23_9PEZI